MIAYTWKGRDAAGVLVKGRLVANCEESCAELLSAQQVTPVQIEAEHQYSATLRKWWKDSTQRRPSSVVLQMFARQMCSLLKAGIPLLRGVKGLAATTPNKPLAEALNKVAVSLEGGDTFSVSLSRHPDVFPPLVVNLVQAGESTGRLEVAFTEISKALSRDQQTKNRVWAALRYPILVVIAIVIAIGVVTTMVVPAFATMFLNMEGGLPWPSQVLMSMSNLVRNHWLTGGLLLATVLCGLYLFRASRRGAFIWDKHRLNIPGLGAISRRLAVARVARALSMSLRSGVPALRAFSAAAEVADNRYLREQLITMRDALEQGAGIHATARATGVFSGLALQMIAVGEESGALDDMLDTVADHYEEEAEFAAAGLSDLLQPFLLLVLAALILLVGLGVFLPVWEMSNFGA